MDSSSDLNWRGSMNKALPPPPPRPVAERAPTPQVQLKRRDDRPNGRNDAPDRKGATAAAEPVAVLRRPAYDAKAAPPAPWANAAAPAPANGQVYGGSTAFPTLGATAFPALGEAARGPSSAPESTPESAAAPPRSDAAAPPRPEAAAPRDAERKNGAPHDRPGAPVPDAKKKGKKANQAAEDAAKAESARLRTSVLLAKTHSWNDASAVPDSSKTKTPAKLQDAHLWPTLPTGGAAAPAAAEAPVPPPTAPAAARSTIPKAVVQSASWPAPAKAAAWWPVPKAAAKATVPGFLKPKPQANFFVFDVVTSKKKTKTRFSPLTSAASSKKKDDGGPKKKVQYDSVSAAAVAGGMKTSARDPTKPKKKKLSSLKKRILLERVERWYTKHPELRVLEKDDAGDAVVVRIANLVRRCELDDDDERDEILKDVRKLCDAIAPVLDIRVVAEGDGDGDSHVPVDVTFSCRADADSVVVALSTRIVGGEQLSATAPAWSPGGTVFATKCFLRIFDVCDETVDFEDADELEEIVSDFQKLADAYGAVVSVKLDAATRAAVVEFADADAAEKAMAGLSQTKIGGDVLRCELFSDGQDVGAKAETVVLLDAVDVSELEDEDEIEEITSDLKKIVSDKTAKVPLDLVVLQKGDARAGCVLVVFASKNDAANAVRVLDGIVLNGRAVVARLQGDDAPASEAPAADAASTDGAVAKAVLAPNVYSTKVGLVKVPLKYAEARKTPKVPNGEAPREYVGAQPLDEVLDVLVTSLLGRLFELQERVRLHDPLKAKKLRRLVFGLREVKRGIRAENIKCVVLAPNIDEGETLGESVNEIVDAAKECGVPLVFALGKRKLGRALRKSVSVSVVGIYSGDGANDEYRALLTRWKHLQTAPGDAVPPAAAAKDRQDARASEQKEKHALQKIEKAEKQRLEQSLERDRLAREAQHAEQQQQRAHHPPPQPQGRQRKGAARPEPQHAPAPPPPPKPKSWSSII